MILKHTQHTIILIFICLFFTTGCVQKRVIEPNKIIKEPSLLKPSPLNENGFYYIKKGFNISQFNHIEVPRITILTDDIEKESIDKRLLSRISIYFRSNLYKELNYVIKDNQGNNQLKLDVSIVSLDVSFDELKFYNFLPYSLALKAITRTTGIESRKLRVHLAIKLIDVQTNETVAMVVDKNVNEEVDSINTLNFTNVKPVLDKWIEHYSTRLFELNSGKYQP